jgi:hypothetical protein
MFKDMVPNFSGQGSYLQPVDSAVACEISFDQADGVPIPAELLSKPEMIVRRAVRVGMYDRVHHKLTLNAAQVAAEWNAAEPGQWTFKNTLNPVVFRSTPEDGLDTKENLENF